MAKMCALGTTQPRRGPCSSLVAAASFMAGPARSPVSACCVLCSPRGGAFYSSRGSCSCPLLSQGLAEGTPAGPGNQPQATASSTVPCCGTRGLAPSPWQSPRAWPFPERALTWRGNRGLDRVAEPGMRALEDTATSFRSEPECLGCHPPCFSHSGHGVLCCWTSQVSLCPARATQSRVPVEGQRTLPAAGPGQHRPCLRPACRHRHGVGVQGVPTPHLSSAVDACPNVLRCALSCPRPVSHPLISLRKWT